MPNNKLKRAISVGLSLSMVANVSLSGSAAELVPINGKKFTPCQTLIGKQDLSIDFSMKSVEAKVKRVFLPEKNSKTLVKNKLESKKNFETLAEKEKAKLKEKEIEPKILAVDDSGSCGENVNYEFVTDTGILTISGKGYVTTTPWASYLDSIKTVVIGAGVTSIGDYTFKDCNNLINFLVDVDNENYASTFGGILYNKDCTKLISCPAKNDMGIFLSLNQLTSIEDYALNNCKNLEKVIIAKGLTSIGNYAFNGCTNLQNVALAGSVGSIGANAFNGCTSLQNVALAGSVGSIGTNAFNGCTSLQNVSITGSIDSIESYAFNNCNKLKKVEISGSITTLGDTVFYGCSVLTDLIYKGTVEPSYGKDVFEGCTQLTSIQVPQEYEGDTFCGLPVERMSEQTYSTSTGIVIEGPGITTAAAIAISVAAVALVSTVVTAIICVKKLACFSKKHDAMSTSETTTTQSLL